MRTLIIDIGGTGIKGIVFDAAASPITERVRVPTPRPAVPEAVLGAVDEIVRKLGEFDRISVGFPGVVVEGVTRTAANLDPSWRGFPLAETLAKRTGRPVRALNDAGLQGFGLIEGRGTEIVITLGTGMGFGLYIDGRYVPNIELAHHPFRKRKSYEERVAESVRKKIGNRRWNENVREVIDQIGPIFNFRRLYLGGGNAARVDREKLPDSVIVADNVTGLRGGVRLWEAS